MPRSSAAPETRSSGPPLRFAHKLWQLGRHPRAAAARPGLALRFLLRSREPFDFTYENANEDEMATAIAAALELDLRSVENLLDELDADEELHRLLAARLREDPLRDDEPRYGHRRIGYCLTRARKPASVIECGTRDGLGASLILRALKRNATEGSQGMLHSLDRAPDAGRLIPEELRDRLDLTIGDVAEALAPVLAEDGVDLLIDGLGPGHPGRRDLIRSAAAAGLPGGLAVASGGEGSTVLADLADELGGRYELFVERPLEHWWRGEPWGIALIPTREPEPVSRPSWPGPRA